MSIADRLKLVRSSLGLTQAEMAARLSVTTRPYQLYENGTRLPQAESLQALIGMGINVNWLLTGEGEMLTAQTAPSASKPVPVAIDEDLNGRIGEAVAAVYAECGIRIGPRDLFRVAADVYNDIASVGGPQSPEERDMAIRLAAAMLRRRLLAANDRAEGSEGKQQA